MTSRTPTQVTYVTATRDAASRAVRQALQTLVPTLVVVAGGSTAGIDLTAVLVVAALTMLVSLLKSVLGAKAPAGAPVEVQVLERAATGAAGAVLGFVTIDGTQLATSIPWEATFTAGAGAAALAVLMFFVNPPTVEGEVISRGVPEPIARATDGDGPFPPRV